MDTGLKKVLTLFSQIVTLLETRKSKSLQNVSLYSSQLFFNLY